MLKSVDLTPQNMELEYHANEMLETYTMLYYPDHAVSSVYLCETDHPGYEAYFLIHSSMS